MQPYNDKDGDSNVDAFEVGDDCISVRFLDGSTYTYTFLSAGTNHVENMKRLASERDGLNAYINKYRPGYQSKY